MRRRSGEMENINKIKSENGDQKKKKNRIENFLPPQSLIPSTDLMNRIFAQLDCIDLLQCSLVCKQWYRDSTELRDAWKNEYLEAYTRLGLSIKRETHPPSTTCSIRASVVRINKYVRVWHSLMDC